MEPTKVVMTCMTTKQKFDVEDPPVSVLANGRFAYRVKCPWEGKNNKELYAYKFCSKVAYLKFLERTLSEQHPESEHLSESEHLAAESEHSDAESVIEEP